MRRQVVQGWLGLVGVGGGRDCIHVRQVVGLVGLIVMQVQQKEAVVYGMRGGSLRCIDAGWQAQTRFDLARALV